MINVLLCFESGPPTPPQPTPQLVWIRCPTYPLSIFMAFLRVILGVSVSGQKSLATANEAGADMTEAVNRWEGETCDFSRKKVNWGLAFLSSSGWTSQSPTGEEKGRIEPYARKMFLWRLGSTQWAKSASPWESEGGGRNWCQLTTSFGEKLKTKI